MSIIRIEVKDFLVFKGEFSADFCSGVNIILGNNGTGKTTLMKSIYGWITNIPPVNAEKDVFSVPKEVDVFTDVKRAVQVINAVYIPEKDLLSNSKKLPESVEYGELQFAATEIDIIKKARVAASVPPQPLYEKICDVIGGEPQSDGESFFMKRPDVGKQIPFSMEASGYRKFGLLATLIRNEQIKKGTVLFWDEPENSLNPELVPVLVDILLELAKNEVQIFLATHDYNLARHFDVRKDKSVPVLYHNLSKADNGQIICRSSPEYTKLPDNSLERANENLFEAVVSNAMGDEEIE